jgi:glycopeptide antibiotics resistance protein
MGIYKNKKTGLWHVKSYVSKRWHKKAYATKLKAEKAAGKKARMKYYQNKKHVEGASYLFIVLIIVLFTLTMVYTVLSTVVNWTFDTIINSPSFNFDRRYDNLSQMMRIFGAIPLAMLISLSLYAILKQMRERRF